MSYKELLETLIKRMNEVGYSPSTTFVKMLLKEYEDLLMDNNTSNILLRSIIARLRGLPDHDRCVWLKAIIDEFDKELSHAKWREGYEQGKSEGEFVGQQLKDADKIRRELNKPVVKQFVADWYEEHKGDLEYNIWDWIKHKDELEKTENMQFIQWLHNCDNEPVKTLVMNIKELIKKIEDEKTIFGNFQGCGVYWEDMKQILKELDELSNPVIPEYVAKWINYCKFTNVSFTNAITVNEIDFYNYANQSDLSKLKDFLSKEENQEIFIRAWFNKYTFEKKYIIKFKGISGDQCYLNCINNNDKTKAWILDDDIEYTNIITKHTHKELEDSNFGWVFDCEGIEVQEVE